MADLPTSLPPGYLMYARSPDFTPENLPDALRAGHTTKAGVWGVVRVIEGRLKLTYLDPESERILDPQTRGLLLPEQPHFVTPIGTMKMNCSPIAGCTRR